MAGPSRLKPGEKGKIIAGIHLAEGWKGPVTRRVKVFSNDPGKPVVILLLRAAIQ